MHMVNFYQGLEKKQILFATSFSFHTPTSITSFCNHGALTAGYQWNYASSRPDSFWNGALVAILASAGTCIYSFYHICYIYFFRERDVLCILCFVFYIDLMY